MHSERTGRIVAVVVAVGLVGALGVMWLRSGGGEDAEVATAAQAEVGDETEGDASQDDGGADSDQSPSEPASDSAVDSPVDDTAEGSDPDADEDASVDTPHQPSEGAEDEPVDEPTEDPTDEAIDAPAEEPSEEPSEDPTDEPDEIDEDLRAELDELRTVGGPAEALVRAEDQDDIDNWLHSAWGMERFQPVSDDTSEWSNRDELWNDIVDAVWDRAVDEYGDRLRHVPGTIWDPNLDRNAVPAPAYGTYATAWATDEYGYRMWVWVGVDPENSDQRRPDAGVFNVQVLTEEEAPGLWHGGLHRVISMCVVPGELDWDEEWGGQVWDAVDDCDSQDLAEQAWETVAEIKGEDQS